MTPGAHCQECGRWRPARHIDVRWVRDPWSQDVCGEWICNNPTKCARPWTRFDRLGGTRLGDLFKFRLARDPRDDKKRASTPKGEGPASPSQTEQLFRVGQPNSDTAMTPVQRLAADKETT